MAVQYLYWQGTASLTAQVDTVVLSTATWTGDGNLTTTMTAEDGSTTQTVITATTNNDQTVNRDAHLTSLQASTQSLFTPLTWASSGAASITATADTAGIPFYQATTEDDTVGTITSDTTTTSSSGPHDFGVKENWLDEDGATSGTAPAGTDHIFIADSSVSILYGLDQNTLSFARFEVEPTFTGIIGNPADGYYLTFDCADTKIDSQSPSMWIEGTHTDLAFSGGEGSSNALQLAGTITNLFVVNSAGTVTCKNSMTVTNVYMAGGGRLLLGSGMTTTDVLCAGGYVRGRSNITDLIVSGGTCEWYSGSISGSGGLFAVTPGVLVHGGTLRYMATDILTELTMTGGLVEVGSPRAPISLARTSIQTTVTNATMYGGSLREVGTIGKVTWSNAVTNRGGIFTPAPGRSFAPASL